MTRIPVEECEFVKVSDIKRATTWIRLYVESGRASGRSGSTSLFTVAVSGHFGISMARLYCHDNLSSWPFSYRLDSNPERRSAESVFALQIQLSRRSGPISLLVLPAKHRVWFERQTCGAAKAHRCWMHSLRPWRASALGALLHGTGTPTADELARFNNHRPSIFSASPLRYTWLLAVQNGWPVAGFVDTSK